MIKPTWLKEAVAKKDGYYSVKGEKLKGVALSDEHVAEWNGEEAAVEEIVEEAAVEVLEEVLADEEPKSKMKAIIDKFID